MRGNGGKVAVSALALLAILFSSIPVLAATVRGRIDRTTPNGVYPAVSMPVTLNSKRTGRSSPVYTDSRGFYYFYDIQPGSYNLEIWVMQRPLVRRVNVGNNPYTDIPPIKVR